MPARSRTCEICGAMIDPERVELVPHTRLCGEHAKMVNKYGGEFIVTAHNNPTNKPSPRPALTKGTIFIPGSSAIMRRNVEGLAKVREEYERGR